MSRCQFKNDPEIGRYHLPGCIGGAVYGPNGCTCGPMDRAPKESSLIKDLERRIAALEALSAIQPVGGGE